MEFAKQLNRFRKWRKIGITMALCYSFVVENETPFLSPQISVSSDHFEISNLHQKNKWANKTNSFVSLFSISYYIYFSKLVKIAINRHPWSLFLMFLMSIHSSICVSFMIFLAIVYSYSLTTNTIIHHQYQRSTQQQKKTGGNWAVLRNPVPSDRNTCHTTTVCKCVYAISIALATSKLLISLFFVDFAYCLFIRIYTYINIAAAIVCPVDRLIECTILWTVWMMGELAIKKKQIKEKKVLTVQANDKCFW